MKSLFVLALFSVVPAFADMSVQCARQGKNNDVYMNDADGGTYEIKDLGNAMVGEQTGLKAKETRDSLRFWLDEGTSRKWIYEYTGMRECYHNDTSKNVKLTIATVLPGERPKVRQVLNCECAQD